MKLQLSPNRWSCLPTSFAMALNIPVKELIAELGHDGSDVLWPSCREPYCRRGFHIQEFIDYCYKRNLAVVEFQAVPTHQGSAETVPYEAKTKWSSSIRIEIALQYNCVLLSDIHAIAWDGKNVFDPSGRIKTLNDFYIKTAYCIFLISSNLKRKFS